MSEHIHIEATGLPTGSVEELEAPSLIQDERPFRKHLQKTWSGKSTALYFYKSGLIKITTPGNKTSPILVRPGIFNPDVQIQYHLPHIFSLLSGAAVITSGTLYYLSIFNEWILAFCMILALALIVTQTTYRATLYSRGGHCPLLSLQTWFVHRQQVIDVVDLITNMAAGCNLGGASLAQMVQEHRRLFNEGLIGEKEYEQAKSKMFTGQR